MFTTNGIVALQLICSLLSLVLCIRTCTMCYVECIVACVTSAARDILHFCQWSAYAVHV